MITKEILANLLAEYKDVSGVDIPQYLFLNIKHVEDTQAKMLFLRKAIEEERAICESKIKKFKADISYLQAQCKHLDRHYHPDASGNNDSYYECNICGKEM